MLFAPCYDDSRQFGPPWWRPGYGDPDTRPAAVPDPNGRPVSTDADNVGTVRTRVRLTPYRAAEYLLDELADHHPTDQGALAAA